MTSNYEPPSIRNTSRMKICLNKKCYSPFDSDSNNHINHPQDLHDVDDLVAKLHNKNEEYKQQLNQIQTTLLERVEENERIIVSLRTKEQGEILRYYKKITSLMETVGAQLVGKKDLDIFDNIFFSTNRLKKFAMLEEQYEQKFDEKFKIILDNEIFRQDLCQCKCLNHQSEKINAFNLNYNIRNQDRLLCKYDDRSQSTSFQECEKILRDYCQNEEYFSKLVDLKFKLLSLRFNTDCITNKILTQVQSLIDQRSEYFRNNQKDFDQLYNIKQPIPQQTYVNLANFLQKIKNESVFKQEQRHEIDRFCIIADQMLTQILDIKKKEENFLYNLKPHFIRITLEVISGEIRNGYHIEAESGSNLQELFDWMSQKHQWDFTINQVHVRIEFEDIRISNQNPYNKYILKDEQRIQFFLQNS